MAKNKLAKFAEMETLENVFQPTHEEAVSYTHLVIGKSTYDFFSFSLV